MFIYAEAEERKCKYFTEPKLMCYILNEEKIEGQYYKIKKIFNCRNVFKCEIKYKFLFAHLITKKLHVIIIFTLINSYLSNSFNLTLNFLILYTLNIKICCIR